MELVELQNKLTGLAAQVSGINHQSNDWGRFGTPGNKSDIDNVYTGKPTVAQADQMLVKVFADTFYTYIMGPDSLSGIQLDVETYLLHPGKTWAPEDNTDPASKGKLYHLELTMAQLQMRNAYGHDHEGWEGYKNRSLAFHDKEPLLRSALNEILTHAEQLHAEIQIDILNEMRKQMPLPISLEVDFLLSEQQEEVALSVSDIKTPGKTIETLRAIIEDVIGKESFGKAYKQANMTYKCQRLLTLSQHMDEDYQALYFPLPPKTPPKLKTPEADRIYISLTKKALLRNVFFDESYFTSGAFNVVCEKEGGQLSKREDEKNIKFIEQSRTSQTLDYLAISSIYKSPRNASTALDFVSSVCENSAQFHHIAFSQKENLGKAAIDSSKYAERTTSSSLEVLRLMEEKLNNSGRLPPEKEPFQKDIKDAFTEIKRLHTMTTALEKRKRQTELDDLTTQKLLEDVLIDPRFTAEKKITIKENITNTLQLFQPGGPYFAQEITSTDKFNFLLQHLTQKDSIFEIEEPQPITINTPIERLSADIVAAFNQMESPLLSSKMDQPAMGLYRTLDHNSQINLLMNAKSSLLAANKSSSPEEIVSYTIEKIKQDQLPLIHPGGVEGRMLTALLTLPEQSKKLFHLLPPNSQIDLLIVAERTARVLHPMEKISHDTIAYYTTKILEGYLHNTEEGLAEQGENLKLKKNLIGQLNADKKASENNRAVWEKNVWFEKSSISRMSSGDEKLDAIFRAKAGFPRIGDREVQALHTLSKESEMMRITGLNDSEIDKYFEDMEKIQHTIIRLTYQLELLPLPSKDNEGEMGTSSEDTDNLVHLWQSTDLSSRD